MTAPPDQQHEEDKQSPKTPGVPDPEKNLAFIRFVIQDLLPRQPMLVQTIILFLFVFLFMYFSFFGFQASMILPIEVSVRMTPGEVQKKRDAGVVIADKSYTPPKPGYAIIYNDFRYALNVDGKTRIDLPIWEYAWIVATRHFRVDLAPDQTTHFPQAVELSGIATGVVSFDPPADQGMGPAAAAEPQGNRKSSMIGLDFVDAARADVTLGGRLYLQAVTLSGSAPSVTAEATLTAGTVVHPLITLSADLTNQSEMPIMLKSGASIVQDYRTFFALPQPALAEDARITLRTSGYFQSAFNDTFVIKEKLNLGKPATIKGGGSNTIVVQLAYPFDVVFFERKNTGPITDTFSAAIARMGYAVRVNASAASSAGDYNVMYSGESVPRSVVQDLLRAMPEGIDLHSIQFKVKLRNGLENQIQIGSNQALQCLPPIPRATLASLAQAPSDETFEQILGTMPKPGSCA
jgi:hypothetical protein